MPDTQQLSDRISTERQTATILIDLIHNMRGQVRRWELGDYGNGLTDQDVVDAGHPHTTATEVQNGINAFAAFVALYDNTWGNPLENISA